VAWKTIMALGMPVGWNVCFG